MESNVQVLGKVGNGHSGIVSPEAMSFVAGLAREFEPTRKMLMQARQARQQQIDAGQLPDFLPETRSIRRGDWQVSPAPQDLQDRKVEITGPASDRKMVINALNSGSRVFMADLEDAHSPVWGPTLDAQVNLRDAIERRIDFTSPEGKSYSLADQVATLTVRPRGWHLMERHVLVDGMPVSASLFDFGLYFYHNAHTLMDQGTGPYIYLPKLQSHQEARLWSHVFDYSEDRLGLPRGSIKATVLIEHILAAFEMEEILYELRDHITALNLGRWDYIFSFIKVFAEHRWAVFPDRAQVTMATKFLRSAAELMAETCHRRGAHAIGGMSAFIPRRDDLEANEKAIAQVRVDKEREASQGCDGAWVAHPGLVKVVLDIFEDAFEGPNQLRKVPNVDVSAKDLLEVPEGDITEAGLRNNISVSLQYLDAWAQGRGAVAINYLMEDTATAEIARAQIWQWIWRGIHLSDGRPVTQGLYQQIRSEEVEKLLETPGDNGGRLDKAVQLFDQLITDRDFEEFLTIPGSRYLD